MQYSQLSREAFLVVVDSITYREQDIKEARMFGCPDIKSCYLKADWLFTNYYVIYEDDVPIVTILLQRDGNIVFFISNTVKKHMTLIKGLRKFAKETVDKVGPIITKTAYWYEEAQRINKLIGFKNLQKYNNYGLYYYEG